MSGTGVKVWDLFIRVFHWSLVILFVVTYFTGEEENTLHIYAGYAIGVLIVARFVWGFVGPKHAQFSDFVRRPSEVTGYMMAMLSGKAPHYDGHNPAGGYMVVALLTMIAVTTITGLKVYGEEGYGPLAGDMSVITVAYADADADADDDDEREGYENREEDEHESGEGESGEEFWEEIHEVAANITMLLIILHILGVIVSSRMHRENLVKAMITGVKEPLDKS
ncbi:MAG: cytochrome B [Gammaproteobacteria bacterium]|nr:MAG: cytochrome B [Gammaproteobacteria bacterium]